MSSYVDASPEVPVETPAVNQVVLDHVPDASPGLSGEDRSHHLHEPAARPLVHVGTALPCRRRPV